MFGEKQRTRGRGRFGSVENQFGRRRSLFGVAIGTASPPSSSFTGSSSSSSNDPTRTTKHEHTAQLDRQRRRRSAENSTTNSSRSATLHRRRLALVDGAGNAQRAMLRRACRHLLLWHHALRSESFDLFVRLGKKRDASNFTLQIIGRVQADPDYLPRTEDFGLNVHLFNQKYCSKDCPKQFIAIAIACCDIDPDSR